MDETTQALLDRLDYKLDLVLRHNQELLAENNLLRAKLDAANEKLAERDHTEIEDILTDLQNEPIQLQLPLGLEGTLEQS